MTSIFNNRTVGVPCPKCGHKTEMTIGWIRDNSEFVCQCGVKIVLNKSQFVGELDRADHALEDFKKQLKRLGK